ncbi:hypothetical protein ACNF40_04980 [Cuniculiplasma sp. SKW4]
MDVNYDDFIKYCKTLEGQTLDTIGKRSLFTVFSVNEDKITFLLFNGNFRATQKFIIQEVLKKFNDSYSLKTTSYTDITQASSYTLSLIKKYIERG